MNILALDTTTRGGSVAVARDQTILHERSGDPARTHGERLPGDLKRALDEAAIRVEELDLLAVAVGPGSFTGLRVGIAAIQGLAVARTLQVVPVPTLEALARAASEGGACSHLVAAWMDGQRGDVFAALYEGLREVEPPMARDPASVLDAWAVPPDADIVFIGDGAVRYRTVITARFEHTVQVMAPQGLAATIARIACEQPHRAVAPHEIVPVYVRRPDAELARERSQQRPALEGRESGAPGSGLGMERDGAAIVQRVTSGRDLDDVAALEAACFTNPWTREMLERELRQSDVARVYVVRDGTGRLTAFCSCWLVADELHINTIAVDPARRRTGLATTLMHHVMAEAVRAGARRATLEVRASNDAARRLYVRLGFVESGVRPHYYTQPVDDAIILWRELPGGSEGS